MSPGCRSHTRRRTTWGGAACDWVGAGLSGLCVAHCALLPVALGVMPAVGLDVLARCGFHRGLAVLAGLAALLAFVPGYLRHRQAGVLAVAAAGVAVLFAASFGPRAWVVLIGETTLTIPAGAALVTAHVLNRMYCRGCGSASRRKRSGIPERVSASPAEGARAA